MANAPMQVFEFARSWAQELVPVFAADIDHAEATYGKWIEAHHPDHPTEATMIFPTPARWLLLRPELRAASELGVPGVGSWDRQGFRWEVLRPDDPLAGELVWPTSAINYYRVRSTDGDELMVFAKGYAEAVGSYLEWHVDAYGWPPDGIQAVKLSKWQLVLALGPLRDQMDAWLTGIARWSPDEGWHMNVDGNGTILSDHMR